MWRRIFPIRGFPTINSQSFFEASLRPFGSSARNRLFDRSTFSPSSRSSSSSSSPPPNSSVDGSPAAPLSCMETKRLLRLVNVEELKKRLEVEGEEVIHYSELLKECQSLGVSKSCEEAEDFAKVLDEAGVVLFRDKVYLHPDKVVELVSRAMPLALTPESDPRRLELKRLQEMKEEIDMLAHKQVRRILWAGLGFFVVQISLFFRLTFWEFSWDVMEPIAFFGTTSGLLIGYAYFLFTSRDPTYQDLLKRLFLSRQRIIFKKRNFDASRFKELQRQLKSPLECIKEVEPILKVGAPLVLVSVMRGVVALRHWVRLKFTHLRQEDL